MLHIHGNRDQQIRKEWSQFMNTRQLNKLDKVQLMQRVIHLQSELSRYKQVVSKYQNNYHYKQFDELKEELEAAKEKIVQKDEDIAELNKVNSELEGSAKQLVERYSGNQEEYEKLKEKLEQLEKENSSLQNKIEQQEKEINNHKEKWKKTQYLLEKDDESPDSWFLRSIKSQKKEEE